LVWLVIDEAHEFLPNKGKTTASDALITILREGRQPGISLILASQQPGKIHTDVMTQSDIVISHRLTARIDIDSLGTLMQSYMRKGLDKQLNDLPPLKGSAVVFDDVNERIYPIRVRPRFTWHGGAAPTAMKKEKKKEFDF
jgi:DNA helicase HerA-like ATPase